MRRVFPAVCASAFAALFSAVAFARPVLQPEVKDYTELGGRFPTAGLPVWHQDQKQCAIAAGETFVDGKTSVWTGTEVSGKGVYIAVADSPQGKALVSAFKLDVPAKKQGYAIKAKDGRVAIVGYDPVGALYGAVTFAQMSAGGSVEAASVRDWPDILYRGGVSIGRGIWWLGRTDGKDRPAALRTGIDWMLRHKLNFFQDYFHIRIDSPAQAFRMWHEISRYAADRGILANDYGRTAVWFDRNAPKDVSFETWPCVKERQPWGEDYLYCWADDELTAAAANRYADYIEKLGAEDGILVIHPVDGGSWQDPERWSTRCAKCRARWNDHERWKASVNQYNIWSRELKRRLPNAKVGSCIYPYTFNALMKPESERSAKWRESMPEYWQKLSAGLEDPEFFFSSWICADSVIRELRKLIPGRPLHFSDVYPIGAGVFHSYHRKLGSVWEPDSETIFSVMGIDTRPRWESVFLMAEYAWNRYAPGAEPYDGGTYYDALVDHAGPKAVTDDVLVRICRTFWGERLAPHLQKALASGVAPAYVEDPAYYIRYWNSIRRDPLFDPTVAKSIDIRGKMQPIEDTPELMQAQVRAAETCVRELGEAAGKLDGLDVYRRRYFMHYLKMAPYWLATARAKHFMRQADLLVRDGRNKDALELIARARSQVESDFGFADANREKYKGEPDARDLTYPPWSFTAKKAKVALERAEMSARVTLSPRKIGREVKVGIFKGLGAKGIKEHFDDYSNVRAEIFDSLSLSELDRFDCVFLTAQAYDRSEFFSNLRAYVERGGGGVYLEGYLCGHERWDRKTPFPDVVETAPARTDNWKRDMVFADGRKGKTMYVDYFELKPGAKGEVRARSVDGQPIAVRGPAGEGKVFFNGTFNLATYGETHSDRVMRLFGSNAELSTEAVEYFTGVRLKRKGE